MKMSDLFPDSAILNMSDLRKHLAGPVYNVQGYGADPLGSADSSQAILDARDEALASRGKVYVPGGIYRIENNVDLSGTHVQFGPGVKLVEAGGQVTGTLDWVRPELFGARDGSNDSPAFAAATRMARNILLLPATYTLVSQVAVPLGIRIAGSMPPSQEAHPGETIINFTGSSGFAFRYTPEASTTKFAGPFCFENLHIKAPNLAADDGGGICIGNLTDATWANDIHTQWARIHWCRIIGNKTTRRGRGVHLAKNFEPDVFKCDLEGWDHGLWYFGSDIGRVISVRALENNCNLRLSPCFTSGIYGGGTLIRDCDLLQATRVSVHVAGVHGCKLDHNYIEQTSSYAIASTQAGTATAGDLTFTATITGANPAALIPARDYEQVLVQLGDEYNQVAYVDGQTIHFTQRWLVSHTSVTWKIIRGTGVIACNADQLVCEGNRVDVTATGGAVPQAWIGGGSGRVADTCGENTLQGGYYVQDDRPGAHTLLDTRGLRTVKAFSDRPGAYPEVVPPDGSGRRGSDDAARAAQCFRPGTVWDAKRWFEQGAGPFLRRMDSEVVVQASAMPGTKLSGKVPSKIVGKASKCRLRVKSLGPGTAAVTVYSGATLGATTTNHGGGTAATTWTEITVSLTPGSYLTVGSASYALYVEFVALLVD